MSITPLQWLSDSGAALVTDDDLKILHPRLVSDLWPDESTYAAQLEAAFAQILVDLEARDFDLDLTPNSTANRAWAKSAATYLGLSMIFLDFRTESGDRWDLLYSTYKTKYTEALEKANLEYDTSEDGTVDTDEKKSAETRLER